MKPPTLEIIVFAAGLTAAIGVGVAAYDRYGMYGDGPGGAGYSREVDPVTGTSHLVHEARTADGLVRRTFDSRGSVVALEVDRDHDGRADESIRIGRDGLAGLGFSHGGHGVIDAWRYTNAAGQTVRIEISTNQDGRIDRWEHYTDGVLTKVEVDKDGDGRPDK